MTNTHLHKAKKSKNDLFYTRREDVEKELKHYEDQLEGKWVYMPFDTAKSAFWQYFKDNFNKDDEIAYWKNEYMKLKIKYAELQAFTSIHDKNKR